MNKFKPESPDPFLKKPEDMAPAKFGHLNEIVREINAGGGGSSPSSPLTASVTVTAAELIAAGAPSGQVVKQLLPASGVGKYYEINKCVVKFKNATVAYDQFPACGLRTSSGSNYKGGSSSVTLPSGTSEQIAAYFIGSSPEVNGDLNFSYISSFGSAVTAGDGDLIFEIEYKILDF